MVEEKSIVDSRSQTAGFPQRTRVQAKRPRQSYEVFLLRTFRDVTKGRRKIPLYELQAELLKRGWHP